MTARFRTKGPSCPCTVTSSSPSLDLGCCCFNGPTLAEDNRWRALKVSFFPAGDLGDCEGFTDEGWGTGIGGGVTLPGDCHRSGDTGILFINCTEPGFLAGVSARCGGIPFETDTNQLWAALSTNLPSSDVGQMTILSCSPFHAIFETAVGTVELTE